MAIHFSVNGEQRTVDVDPDTPLLWVLRDELGLKGTKFGCGIASCGACTVFVDGSPTRSCSTPVDSLEGSEVVTIDALNGKAADAVRQAKARGLPVTAEAAPVHFALNELEVEGYRTFAKVSPPLRTEADRRAVVAGLVDGTIDVIASDHWPQDEDSKRLPFAQAEFGVVGLETLLPIALELVHNGTLGLIDLLDKLTRAPAELLRLDAGRLRKGAPADLVLFDPEAPGQVRVEDLKSLSKNTAFEGRLIQGKVLRTLVDGRTIYQA